MISIFKKTEGALSTLETPVAGSWVNAITPDAAEIERLLGLGVPESFITAALDDDERARTDIRYWTVPLGIVLVGEIIVIIGKYPNAVVDSLL